MWYFSAKEFPFPLYFQICLWQPQNSSRQPDKSINVLRTLFGYGKFLEWKDVWKSIIIFFFHFFQDLVWFHFSSEILDPYLFPELAVEPAKPCIPTQNLMSWRILLATGDLWIIQIPRFSKWLRILWNSAVDIELNILIVIIGYWEFCVKEISKICDHLPWKNFHYALKFRFSTDEV